MKHGWAAAACLVVGMASCSPVDAALYYLSDCQAGAVPGCVPGNDANNGSTPATPWRSMARAREVARAPAAGDRILFARGGAWSEAALAVTLGKRPPNDQPFIIDSYATPWSSDVRPILTLAPGANALVSLIRANAVDSASRGIVRNLEFRGRDGKGVGVLVGQGVSDVVMERLVVTGFSVGVQCSAGSHRVRLIHSKLADNSVQGARWECDPTQFEGTTLNDRTVVPERLPPPVILAPPTGLTVQ